MLPPPATPINKPTSTWGLRVPRDAAFKMLRNNITSLAGLLLFNWFFPVYPYLKAMLLPKSWLKTFTKIGMWPGVCLSCYKAPRLTEATEVGLLALIFGVNIIVALVSIRYPRPPYPPLRTPSKPVANVTPVRRPIKGLGTSRVCYHTY